MEYKPRAYADVCLDAQNTLAVEDVVGMANHSHDVGPRALCAT